MPSRRRHRFRVAIIRITLVHHRVHTAELGLAGDTQPHTRAGPGHMNLLVTAEAEGLDQVKHRIQLPEGAEVSTQTWMLDSLGATRDRTLARPE